jgi:uncharacterized protein (DUF433 family)
MGVVITQSGRIEGTRSSVYNVLHYVEGNWPPMEIATVLRLSFEQVQAAMKYIDEHRDEVMAVHREIEARIAQGNPPEILAKLKDTRARMQAWAEERRQAKKQEADGAGDRRGC